MAPASEDDLPEVLGAYRVVRRLATGGTSDVLLARAEGPYGFERPVVLKVLLRELRDDDRFGQMFVREAAAYARLSHPAIVRLYDFFADTGGLVLVLEYVDGLPLHRLMALLHRTQASMADAAAFFVGWRLFSGLASAHAAQDLDSGVASPVIHGDVNPSNVLIPWDGHVKIADFGMARVTGVDGADHASLMKGTYGYSAPEQVRGEAMTVRSDVYAGCVMLWELLAHRKAVVRQPSQSSEAASTIAAMAFPALRSLRPDLPAPILDAFDRGLQPDPARRWLTAAEMCTLLRGVVDLQGGRRSLVESLDVARRPVLEEDDEDDDDLITMRMSGESVFPPVAKEDSPALPASAPRSPAAVTARAPAAKTVGVSVAETAKAAPEETARAGDATKPAAPGGSVPRPAGSVSKASPGLPFVPRPGTAIAKPTPAMAVVPRPVADAAKSSPPPAPAIAAVPTAVPAPAVAAVPPVASPMPPRPAPGTTATKLLGSVSRPPGAPIPPSPPRDPAEVARPSQPPPTPKVGRMAMELARASAPPSAAAPTPPPPPLPAGFITQPPTSATLRPGVAVPTATLRPGGTAPAALSATLPLGFASAPATLSPPSVASAPATLSPPSVASAPATLSGPPVASSPPPPVASAPPPAVVQALASPSSVPPPPVTPSPIFALSRTSVSPSVPPSGPVFDLSRPARPLPPGVAGPTGDDASRPSSPPPALPWTAPSPPPPLAATPGWGGPSLAPPSAEAPGEQVWADGSVRPRRARWVQAAAGAAAVALAIFFVLTLSRSRTFAQGSASEEPLPSGTALASHPPPPAVAPPAPQPPPAAAPPAPVPAPPAPSPPPAAGPAAAAPAATTGTITALMKGGHRVWIDSKIVGQSPASFSVACGPHAVRVGSHGATRHVDVACGSEVFVK